MKKIIAVILTLTLMFSNCFVVFAAESVGMENFKETKEYAANQFSDVPESSWYAENVKTAYKLSLVNGTSASTFSPNSNITIAETITLASRLHNIYNGSTYSFVSGDVWYQTYVDYAISNGIIKENEYSDYNAFATRAQFAQIFAASLPDEALAEINEIPDNAIPDVPANHGNAAAIYKLYRAGILTGNDEKGTFAPSTNIQRSAVAAIVSRMAKTEMRKTFTLGATEEKETQTGAEEKTRQEQAFEALKAFVIENSNDDTFNEEGDPAYSELYEYEEGEYFVYSIAYNEELDLITLREMYIYQEEELDIAVMGLRPKDEFVYCLYSNTLYSDLGEENFEGTYVIDPKSFTEKSEIAFDEIVGNPSMIEYCAELAKVLNLDMLDYVDHIFSTELGDTGFSMVDFGFKADRWLANSGDAIA